MSASAEDLKRTVGPGLTSVTYTTINVDKTPTNSNGSVFVGRRIRAATGGDLAVQYPDGSTDVIPALADGEVVDGYFSKILASGSTASNITVWG